MSPLAIISAAFTFFNSKLGRIAGVGLITLAVYSAGEIRGRRVATEACKAAAEKAQKAADTQDRVAKEGVEANDNDTLDMLQKQKVKADATIASLQQQLLSRPAGAPCVYGPDGKPATGGVRDNASGGARNSTNPPAAVVPPARHDPPRN